MFIPKKSYEELLNFVGIIKDTCNSFNIDLTPDDFYIQIRNETIDDTELVCKFNSDIINNEKNKQFKDEIISKINKKLNSLNIYDEYLENELGILDFSNPFSNKKTQEIKINNSFINEKFEEKFINLNEKNLYFLIINQKENNELKNHNDFGHFIDTFSELFLTNKVINDTLNFKIYIINIFSKPKKEEISDDEHKKNIQEYITKKYNEIISLLHIDINNEINKNKITEYLEILFVDNSKKDSSFFNINSELCYYQYYKDYYKLTKISNENSYQNIKRSLLTLKEQVELINNTEQSSDIFCKIRKFNSDKMQKNMKYLSNYAFKYTINVKISNNWDKFKIVYMDNITLNGKVRSNDYNLLKDYYNKLVPSDSKSNSFNLQELETFTITPLNKCTECGKTIQDNEFQYNCYWCHISFCINCVENKIKENSENLNKYLHRQHNLLYFVTRNPENLSNLDKYKLGKNLIANATNGDLSKHHSAICNGCHGGFDSSNVMCQRYICVTCRPGIYRSGGYCDFCFECIKKYREGIAPRDVLNDDSNHSNENHVYFMLICQSDGYNEY